MVAGVRFDGVGRFFTGIGVTNLAAGVPEAGSRTAGLCWVWGCFVGLEYNGWVGLLFLITSESFPIDGNCGVTASRDGAFEEPLVFEVDAAKPNLMSASSDVDRKRTWRDPGRRPHRCPGWTMANSARANLRHKRW